MRCIVYKSMEILPSVCDKFLRTLAAEVSNGLYCNSQRETLMNRLTVFIKAYWLERI